MTKLRHSLFKLQSWDYTLWGLLILPIFPALGAVGLALALLTTLWPEKHLILRHPLNWGFAFLSILLIITSIFAERKTEAFLGLFNFLPYFLFFAALSALIRTPAQLKQISWILVLSSLPVIVIGWGQIFGEWVTPKYWDIFGWTIAPGGNPPGRMASVFMYANTLAGYLVLVFVLNLGLLLAQIGNRIRLFPFALLLVMAIANASALILTNSRSAWVITLIVCLAYALYLGWRILVAGLVAIAASVMLAAFAPPTIAQMFRQFVPAFFWARFNDQLYPDRPVALMRHTQWNFAWEMTLQRPWTGWGLRNFTPLYEAKMQIWLGHPHNFFLMLSAETGLLVTLVFCALMGWILFACVKFLNKYRLSQADRAIVFSYFLVVIAWLLLNTADVTLFDFRLNLLTWLLLAAISGVVLSPHNQDN